VGQLPAASAVGGQSVWVYNRGDSISEIDDKTDRVRKTTPVSTWPSACCGAFTGPVLAADASGAWFVSGSNTDGRLTHLLAGGGGQRELRLDVAPRGVAVGDRTVWVIGRGRNDYQLLQIDPATGRVSARRRFARPIDSVSFGFGYVWVVGSADATLYRIDPRTARLHGKVVLGNPPAGRPQVNSYEQDLDVAYSTTYGSAATVNPSTLSFADNPCSCRPSWGEDLGGFGSDWWDDSPTGSVYRQWSPGGPTRRIAVVKNPPVGGGPCLTSIVNGAGSFWVTVGPSVNYACIR
jgi:hypothetical protein